MPKCLRCGCHHPPHTSDGLGLGLCALHNQQFRDGTIGQDYNPRSKEHPAEEAAALLQMVQREYFGGRASVRKLAEALGTSKDFIWQLKHGRWTHVRSATWEAMLDGAAQLIYEAEQHEQSNTLKAA